MQSLECHLRDTCMKLPTNGHLSTTTTCRQRPPVHNDHLSTATTCPQRPPVDNDHQSTPLSTINKVYDVKLSYLT